MLLIAGFMFISIWEGRNPWHVFKQAQLNDTLTKDLHAVAGLLFHLSHCELKSVPSQKKGVRCHFASSFSQNLNPLGMALLFSLSKCSSGHTAGRCKRWPPSFSQVEVPEVSQVEVKHSVNSDDLDLKKPRFISPYHIFFRKSWSQGLMFHHASISIHWLFELFGDQIFHGCNS